MAAFGVNEMVAVVDEALTPDARVMASPVIAPVIAGNVPLVVASMMTETEEAEEGENSLRLFDVPAAMFLRAACALGGGVISVNSDTESPAKPFQKSVKRIIDSHTRPKMVAPVQSVMAMELVRRRRA
jgi:hypothetical protein